MPPALSSAQIRAVPALARIASEGAQIYELGETHGMQAVFARSGSHFQVFYITPDGDAEIGGIMWDAAGKDLTLSAVRDIPGVVPTVTVGNTSGQPVTSRVTYQPGAPAQAAQTALPQSAPTASPAAVIAALNASTNGSAGPADAPHLYMLIDPMCGFSVRAMQGVALRSTLRIAGSLAWRCNKPENFRAWRLRIAAIVSELSRPQRGFRFASSSGKTQGNPINGDLPSFSSSSAGPFWASTLLQRCTILCLTFNAERQRFVAS
jgi:hypothetical protein